MVAADIDSSALERLNADLGHSPRLIVVTSNVSSPEGAGAIAATAAAATAFVDILVNNAGIYPSKSFETMTFDEWRAVIDRQSSWRFPRHKSTFATHEGPRFRTHHQHRFQ